MLFKRMEQTAYGLPAFYGTRRIITVFPRVLYRALSWARWTKSTLSHPIPLWTIADPILKSLHLKAVLHTSVRCKSLSFIEVALWVEFQDDRKALKYEKFWEKLIAYFPWYDTGHIENDASNNSSTVACVFVIAVTFLPSRCLATIGGYLPSRYLALLREFLPSCRLATIEGFSPSRCPATIRKLLPSLATIGGIHIQAHTHRQQRDLISLLSFLQIKESRLKMYPNLSSYPAMNVYTYIRRAPNLRPVL
jgi:hypothetical protein